jgi:hypothetical protein
VGFSYQNPLRPTGLTILFFVDDKFSKSRLSENLKNPDIVRIIYAEEFVKANPQDIVDLCYDFHRQYYPNIRFLVDDSNAGFVRQLKVVFGENPDYDYKDVSTETMEILPVSFSTEHKQMLSYLYMMINKEYLAIPENMINLLYH